MKMRRLKQGGAVLFGLLIFLLGSSALARTASSLVDPIRVTAKTDSDTCLECHGVEGFAVPKGKTGDSLKRGLHVQPDTFKDSVHAEVHCVSCHVDIKQMPHKTDVDRSVDCITCHKEQLDKDRDETRELVDLTQSLTHAMAGLPSTAQIEKQSELTIQARHYLASIHAQPREDDPSRANASCWDCHGKHNVFPMDSPSAQTYRTSTPETCGACHEEELKEYTQSVHGAPIKRFGELDPAVCSDCHTAHEVSVVEQDPAKLIITDNCGNCHEEYYDTYRETYHGQVVKLGYTHTAKCHDCHAHHATRKADDPLSMVHADNRLTTCRECHKDATEGYLTFQPHGTTHDYERYPELWITSKFMIVLLIGVFLFFWTHSLLWYFREKKEREQGQPKIRVEEDGTPVQQGQFIQRFTPGWRLAHLVLAVAVMILVITGTTVLFADSFWAPTVMILLGGSEVAAILHRIAAVTFGAIFLGHLVVIFHKIYVVNKDRKFNWFGPDSLVPRWQDLLDFIGMCKWFAGKGPQPVFDRWTYWEKFDYWAPFWGMFIIGLSGLTLWFPNFFASFLPGWVFNVATVIHGEEAFLAAVFLFTVHFFNCHFRPEKFPMDIVMFTGSMTLEEFKEERKVEYDRLVKEGKLNQYLVGAPSAKMNKYSRILGFSLIAVGLIELVLVLMGFVQGVLFS